MDIDQALSSTTDSPTITEQGLQRTTPASTIQSQPEILRRSSLSEALPDEADGFEWEEQTADLADLMDGMAALSVEPAGIGYLGT